MTITSADKPAFIRARGADARSFLHAQLTCRVTDLGPGEVRLGAWCNAKGRVRALFRLLSRGDDIYMRLPEGLLPRALPAMRMFVLRSAVELTEVARDSAEHHEACALVHGLGPLGEIEAGLPEVYAETWEGFIPQMLDLDRIGAIDFGKGCYPGQEVVARAQYRGEVKRRLFRMHGDETGAPGLDVVAGDDVLGSVVRSAVLPNGGALLLAVLQTEAALRTDLCLASPVRARLTRIEPAHSNNG